jgi:antitoxin PrlF
MIVELYGRPHNVKTWGRAGLWPEEATTKGASFEIHTRRMTSASSADNVSSMNDSNPASSVSTILSRSETDGTDASKNDQELCEFLTLLEDDILGNPGKLIALDSTLQVRLDSLIGYIDVDINSPLSADDE